MTDAGKFRDILLEKRAELRRERDPEDIAITRVADELENIQRLDERELTIRLMDKDASLLRSVEEALLRIRDEEYGICLECEEEINLRRLQAIPWARYCLQCQERKEREEKSVELSALMEDVA